MTETTVPCDSCKRDTALHLLYPFPLAGKFNNTGFRCNVCVDTENRLVAKFGIMRDEINEDLADGPFERGDVSIGYVKDYLHHKTFPLEDSEIIPFAWETSYKRQASAYKEFLNTQDEFMLTGTVSPERLVSIMAFLGSLLEEMNRTSYESIHISKLRRLISTTFDREEGDNE